MLYPFTLGIPAYTFDSERAGPQDKPIIYRWNSSAQTLFTLSFPLFYKFLFSFFLVTFCKMATAKSASYDYLIKLLLIGDSGIQRWKEINEYDLSFELNHLFFYCRCRQELPFASFFGRFLHTFFYYYYWYWFQDSYYWVGW